MITGQYSQAWDIYEALQREFEKDPERVKQSQPVIYFALKEEEPRINKVRAELKREQDRRAEVESELSDKLRAAHDALFNERIACGGWQRRAEEHERRANTLEERSKPVELKYEPGEREALMQLGWRKAV